MSQFPDDPATILCVDDESIILLALREELRGKFGSRFDYEIALNADEALTILNELTGKIVIVISDWMMPGMKGDEFLIKVKEDYPNICTILITGYADSIALERLKNEARTHAIFPKPWNSLELMNAIETCYKS